MAYELKEVISMLRVYEEVEYEAKIFLSVSAYAMKNKEHQSKSAQKTLAAIEEYKKLPAEVRKELEKDSSTQVSKIVQLEKLCRALVKK